MVMAKTGRRSVGGLAGLFLVACWGCGDGAPAVSSSTDEANVKGTVTIRGKPVNGGEVVFDPSNIKRRDAALNSAKIGSDGTYTLKTLVGENAVRVRGPQVDKDPALATNQLNVDVKSGENTIPVDVK
jgi:hypothetical protein